MAKDKYGLETELFILNINWEPTLSDPEKILLLDIQYKCRLPKGACTESNKTIGKRLGKSADTINRLAGSLHKKRFTKNIKDLTEISQRRIELTEVTEFMISNPFPVWYCERVGKFAYPPMTEKQLKTIINNHQLKKNLPKMIKQGLIKMEDPTETLT
jgi:hypothetical protein